MKNRHLTMLKSKSLFTFLSVATLLFIEQKANAASLTVITSETIDTPTNLYLVWKWDETSREGSAPPLANWTVTIDAAKFGNIAEVAVIAHHQEKGEQFVNRGLRGGTYTDTVSHGSLSRDKYTFTFNRMATEYPANDRIYLRGEHVPVPEPLTILGSGIALGFGALLKKEYMKKQKR